MEPGWMASIRSRTGMLLLMDPSCRIKTEEVSSVSQMGVFLHGERELLTLKPLMVPLPACVRASLTQVTMVSSLTFCPSPRSSRMLSVYLQTEEQRDHQQASSV